jgi:hypothetical protein
MRVNASKASHRLAIWISAAVTLCMLAPDSVAEAMADAMRECWAPATALTLALITAMSGARR